ncbi:MAG: GNAT family N-acetyltransferase [Bdellovibrionales bacterium]|nr:GNAT family N-acetyltransferase [Bdellovibrionales bacterium]
MAESTLPTGYTIRPISTAEFTPLYETHGPRLFSDLMVLKMMKVLGERELTVAHGFRDMVSTRYRLNLGVFHKDEFVGWSWGYQTSPLEYYMENSAVFPEHRRKGLYAALVREVIHTTTEHGFAAVYSLHHLVNNPVIIPKLQAGFIMTGFNVMDLYGTLVRLDYFANPMRHRIMEVRCGYRKPDAEILSLFGQDDL